MNESQATRRSCCPVACALDLIGDRWSLLIIRDLFRGASRYRDFQRSPEGMATNVLASRLATLTEHGIVEKVECGAPKRKEYRLTERGRSLGPVLRSLGRWGLDNIRGADARLAPLGTF